MARPPMTAKEPAATWAAPDLVREAVGPAGLEVVGTTTLEVIMGRLAVVVQLPMEVVRVVDGDDLVIVMVLLTLVVVLWCALELTVTVEVKVRVEVVVVVWPLFLRMWKGDEYWKVEAFESR